MTHPNGPQDPQDPTRRGGSAPDSPPPEPPAAREPSPEPADDEVVEGEIVEPGDSEQAEADALLAEALDAETIEAEFSTAEADLKAASDARDQDPVAILTADLQRVHAEYSNYRKRVERDRDLVRERAVEATLTQLLPVLDDIGRARDHGELVGGFRSVGEALEGVVAKLGLVAFGSVGEPFDPMRHEALMREERDEVDEPTVVSLFQVGYEMHGRVVRPARVSVAGAD